MRFIDKISYSQYWNIGICEQTMDDLVGRRALKHIRWMKHSFNDRWFADPFLLKVTDSEFVVLVEECSIVHPKGIISELVIEKKSMRLKNRYKLLELDTHLSYPIIYRLEDKIYVCPENGQSGTLTIYEYDALNHKLKNPNIILGEAVADSTIIYTDSQYYLFATKYPCTQDNLYLYKSSTILGPYMLVSGSSVQSLPSCSRPAGNFFEVQNLLYRPSQNCTLRYGGSLSIMTGHFDNGNYSESLCFNIMPSSYRYNLGLHTINSHDKYLIVDGYGYQYPVLGRLINFLRLFKHRILSTK